MFHLDNCQHARVGGCDGAGAARAADSLERLEASALAQDQVQQCVHELAARQISQVRAIYLLGLVAQVQRVETDGAEMARIVVVAGDHRVKPSRKDVIRVVELEVVLVGEEDAEVAVQLRGSEVAELPRHAQEADQVVPGGMSEDFPLHFLGQIWESDSMPARSGGLRSRRRHCEGERGSRVRRRYGVGAAGVQKSVVVREARGCGSRRGIVEAEGRELRQLGKLGKNRKKKKKKRNLFHDGAPEQAPTSRQELRRQTGSLFAKRSIR